MAALVRRELAARYRGGALGFLWSFLNPLLLLLVYATVFRFVFAPRADVRPYALFLFGGVLVWGFVSVGAARRGRDVPRRTGRCCARPRSRRRSFRRPPSGARLAHLLLALPVLAAAIVFAVVSGERPAGPAVPRVPDRPRAARR